MNAISAIARSGMVAATASLGSAAHNIANLGTDGFHRQVARQSAVEGGGVTTDLVQAGSPGHAPEQDVVEMLAAKHRFLANLAVFRVSDTMAGRLLDLRA